MILKLVHLETKVDELDNELFDEETGENKLNMLALKLDNAAMCNTPVSSDADLYIADEEGNVIERFADGYVKTKNFDSSKASIAYADDSDKDLNIGDEKGNVILQLSDGYVKTKNFDSSKASIAYADDSDKDLNIGDENGNVILQLSDGHIKTKNFDSSKVAESGDWLKGKTVAIFGDSISTNGDPKSGDYANVPEIEITSQDVGVELSAYVTYYDVQAGLTINGHTYTTDEIGTEVTFTPSSVDIGKIIGKPLTYNPNSRKTWWEVAAEVLKFTPIAVCWSGSSITSHEASGDSYKCSYSWHESQIRKAGVRTIGTMERTAPDVIIVYRGTNDFSHSPHTVLTTDYFKSGTAFAYPTTDLLESGSYGYCEGIALLVSKLREAYPLAKIFLCTMNVFKRNTYDYFPTRNGQNSLPEYNNAIREAADYLGCGIIEFDKDGITFENGGIGGYFGDYSESIGAFTHPNDKGHFVMGKKAIADLLAQGYEINE